MKITNTLQKMITKPQDPNSWNLFTGRKGLTGVVLSTLALEFGTQGVEAFIPQSREILGKAPAILQNKMTKVTNVFGIPQSLNVLDVRDIIVLMPAITSALRIPFDKSAQAKKSRIAETIAGVATKGILRLTGLNPSLLSKGSHTAPQAPRVTASGGLASNMGVYN